MHNKYLKNLSGFLVLHSVELNIEGFLQPDIPAFYLRYPPKGWVFVEGYSCADNYDDRASRNLHKQNFNYY